MAMLEGVEALTLAQLNEATQAWSEQEYHRRVHSELGCTPLARYLKGPEVARQSPGSEQLRQAFRQQVHRRQRRSDGTVSVSSPKINPLLLSRYLTPLHLRQKERQFFNLLFCIIIYSFLAFLISFVRVILNRSK